MDRTIKHITDREEFQALARGFGVRPDWHEPDEQMVTARVYGESFDNAGFPVSDDWQELINKGEMTVVFYNTIDRIHTPVAMVLLANLCAWASQEKE